MENFNNLNNMEWNNNQNAKNFVFWDVASNEFIDKIIESKFFQGLLNLKFFNKSNSFVSKNAKIFFSLFWILIIAYSIFYVINSILRINSVESISYSIKIISILFTIISCWIFIFLWFWVIKRQKWIPNVFVFGILLWILNFLSQILKLLSYNTLTVNVFLMKFVPLFICCIITLYMVKNKELFDK